MASRTPVALLRAFARAGLDHLVTRPAVTVEVFVRNGVRHQPFGCDAYRRATKEDVALLSVLQGVDACPDPECVKRVGYLSGGSELVHMLESLLEADELARSAQRYAQAPTKTSVAGKADKLCSQLSARGDQLDAQRSWTTDADVLAAYDRIQAACSDALDAVEAARVSPDLRAKVLDRVLGEMLPRSLRGRVTLDDSPILAGIVSRGGPPRKVQEVVDAFAIGGAAPMRLLACPRFVADYLHRYYDAGSSSSLVLLTVSTVGMLPEQQRAVARMWAPSSGGPMANLATAVEAAAMCLEEAPAGS